MSTISVAQPNIKVKLTRQENTTALKLPLNSVIVLPIEEYLLGVVPAEVGNAPIEAAKAQAIAARTYALNLIKNGATILDQPPHQAYRYLRSIDKAFANAHAGVKATAGMVLTYSGKMIDGAYYSDSNGGIMLRSGEVWSSDRPYLVHSIDSWTVATGKPKNGHGVGLSQVGSSYAAKIGVKYDKILSFYYPGTSIADNYNKGEIKDMADMTGLNVVVNTSGAAGLNLWSTTNLLTRKSIIKVAKGEVFKVIKDPNNGWVTGEYKGLRGYADKKYLVVQAAPKPPVVPPVVPVPKPIDAAAVKAALAKIEQGIKEVTALLPK